MCNLITRQLAYMSFIEHCIIVEIMRINRLFNIICHLHSSIKPYTYFLSIYLSTYLRTYLPVCPSVCCFTHPPNHPSIYLLSMR